MKRLSIMFLAMLAAVAALLLCVFSRLNMSCDYRARDGGISMDDVRRYGECIRDVDILAGRGIFEAAVPLEWEGRDSVQFTYLVPSGAISDQHNTGRCWMFSGLNVLRRKMVAEYGIADIEFSQDYLYFYDLLEKSNLFLQGIIDSRRRPLDDRMVEKLLARPIWDGGKINGFYELVMKYGLVPKECMEETAASVSSKEMKALLNLKLREDALILRKLPRRELSSAKQEMLSDIYRMLVVCLGEPPDGFEWGLPGGDKASYTPNSFYDSFFGEDLTSSHVLLMNDPGKPYGKMYEVDFDRHLYDGSNWHYLNLPMERIHEIAVASLSGGVPFYFTCDNDWMYDRLRGVLSLESMDFERLFGVHFNMDKKGRISTGASVSVHAMTMTGVALGLDGKALHYLCENSFGPERDNAGLVVIDASWLDEYLFRMSVERRFLPDDLAEAASSRPVRLPIWDRMF